MAEATSRQVSVPGGQAQAGPGVGAELEVGEGAVVGVAGEEAVEARVVVAEAHVVGVGQHPCLGTTATRSNEGGCAMISVTRPGAIATSALECKAEIGQPPMVATLLAAVISVDQLMK